MINDLYEDMDRLNALYEELMWPHDVALEFTADYENNRIIIKPKIDEYFGCEFQRSDDIYDVMDFRDEDKNTWWREFEFTFVNGVVDKKELIKFEMEETAEEAKEREKDWEVANAKRKVFQRTFRYRFFSKLTGFLRKLLSWSEQKTYINYISMPAEKRSKEKLSFWKHY